ncbi:autotransporter secretion outer membrane protein TamA [Enterovibrio nigricans DSM 22720]|uniref:Translocation and assembly module subunit TamA n=1 Tax=Enterovibrio nigricans DSM 22720 TaxID=1121868 RepID=A0A1T4U1I8_9GAMM|nr:autotransporter assembly complex family protein [Enterovibrio nigricans]SKA46523.1 autotransporter secretion outer membrane protein TamA [Enterovibrio nigricans DSM 22720]
MIIKRLIPWVICSVLGMPGVAIADVDFDIKGLDDGLKDNVEVYLDAISQNDRRIDFRLQSRVTDEATKALQALGYFDPNITFSIEDQQSDTDATVVLNIDPGKPVIISDVDIQMLGGASSDPAFKTLLETAPQKGDVLNQGQYDALKSSIQSLAVRRGYFDAEYSLAKLEVAPGLHKAFIRLHFDSGVRYRFGPTIYHNSQINEDRLDSMMAFKEGDPYLVSDLGAFNQALSNTGWFSSVLVEAGLDDLRDGRVPIAVSLDPAPRNQFETGIGYSTDTGPRVKIGWRKPWFNSRGHSLNTDLYVSKPKQTLESTYKIPLEDVEREYYQVQLGLENLDNNDTKSLEWTSSISRHWKYDTGWQRSLYLRWLYSDYTQGAVSNESNLILPGINFSRVRSRGGAMPYWGDKQSITFEAGDPALLSDIRLFRMIGQTAWIRSANDDNRFLFRANAGGVFTSEFERVPPSLRFFAGGDNSIRGYSYESISPKDNNGNLEGGSYMATGSLEYNYRVTGNWWAAVFTDAGDAWTTSDPEWKTSVGVGVRWESPVGPIRLDLAHGFENKDDDFMIHFSLGPEL